MPLKTCAHVLFRMMGIVSIKRGLPFHRCANGFLTNKIGQSLIHNCRNDCIRKSESNISHNCQSIPVLLLLCVNHSNLFTLSVVFVYSDLSRSGAQITKINK